MKLALAQLEIERGNVSGNLQRAVESIEDAGADGADLVALPELFTVGYFAFDAYQRTAEPVDGQTVSAIADAAARNDVAVLAGTIVEDLEATTVAVASPTPASEGLANTAVLVDADGEIRLVYRKHHLFGYDSAEADRLVPGERIDTATIAGIEVGVTTCYDLRFPSLYRELLDAGTELVLVPSAWPYPRIEHWQCLPQARAIENLWYVAAVNGAATDEEPSLVGRSAVYDPWGTRVAAAGEGETILQTEVDSNRVAAVREEFPALRDRRD